MLDLTTHSKNSATGIRYVTVQHTPGIAPYLVQAYRATLEKVAGHPLLGEYFNNRGTHIKSGFNDIRVAYLYLVDFLGRLVRWTTAPWRSSGHYLKCDLRQPFTISLLIRL